jgi:hypothetical protein
MFLCVCVRAMRVGNLCKMLLREDFGIIKTKLDLMSCPYLSSFIVP